MRALLLCLIAAAWPGTPATGALAAAQAVPERQLWVYPAPDQEAYRSERYRVTVGQAGRAEEAFCYQIRSPWHHEYPAPWTAQFFPVGNHWASFSFGGAVTVWVEPIGITPIGVEVRPDPPGVAASVEDGRVRVDISRPGQYYVLVKADGQPRHDFDHPLFLFANPPEVDVPEPDAPGVHYFGPGVHDIGFQYRVGPGETVYLAGGAFVRGSLFYEGSGVRIHGRGILSDRELMLERIRLAAEDRAAGSPNPWDRGHDDMFRDKWATIYGDYGADGALIEGITLIESPFYMVRTHGEGTEFRNLKLMSDLYNNNGIVAGPNHRILDCFFKVEDDVFCWMSPVSETRGCVIWKQDNGAVVQLGYGYSYATQGHVFANNWIIRDTATVEVMDRALFGLASSTGAAFTDCQIENLKVWGDVLSFLAIDNWDRPTPWAHTPEGEVTLGPIELTFRNVEIMGTEAGSYWGPRMEDLVDGPMRSRLRTEGAGSVRIVLDDVRINGRRLRGDADWPNGLLRQGDVTVEYR